MEKLNRAYFSSVIQKLNAGHELREFIPGVLENLCTHFGFGSGFVYWADHAGLQRLHTGFTVYSEGSPAPELDLETQLGTELAASLAGRQEVSFREHTEKDALAEALARLFDARSMVLVPMVDNDDTLMGLVGIIDRRGEGRLAEDDLTFTYLVLDSVATHIRMRLYRYQRETTRETLERVLDNMNVDVYVNDFYTHEILYANRSMGAPYGGPDKLIGKVCWQALYNDKTGECDYCPQKKLLNKDGNPSNIYSWDYQRPLDGVWFRVLSAAFRWTDGRLAHIVSSVDITESKRNEDIIRQLAEYDHLTGLPNRYKWANDSDARVEQGDREGFVLFFDLDGFKAVNDRLGHKAGDALLVQIGEFLRGGRLTRDVCYRYGGDEFVLMHKARAGGTVDDVCAFLLERFSRPWRLDDDEAVVGVSIGVSHFPLDSGQPSQLLRMADLAMYAAKRAGGNAAWFYNRGHLCPAAKYRRKDK